ncbi:hypothetical protein [Haladaptatus sp. DFWS20]|uniref:hypothetical protein n=1 Tax=Haladaptatus sp. DFWS20 TaxID=3403467 RepID=UPI003EB727E1
MANKRKENPPAEDSQSEFDRGFDAGVEQEREFYERNRPYEKRRGGLKAVIGIVLSLLGFLLVAILAIGVLFLLFMGGIWLGALATPELGDVPVAPVIPQSGVDGDVAVVEGDTTVTVAGSGGGERAGARLWWGGRLCRTNFNHGADKWRCIKN